MSITDTIDDAQLIGLETAMDQMEAACDRMDIALDRIDVALDAPA
jgi:hypothetical protein